VRDVAIVGTGQTKFGRWDKSNTELFCDAALEAMEEANVRSEGYRSGICGRRISRI
jgi:hypothetical protein